MFLSKSLPAHENAIDDNYEKIIQYTHIDDMMRALNLKRKVSPENIDIKFLLQFLSASFYFFTAI